MLSLPKSLPSQLRSELEKVLNGKTFQAAAAATADKVAELIGAEKVILFLSSQSQVAEEQELRHCRALKENSAIDAESLLEAWLKPGVHEKAFEQISARSAAVSYSSFSWPFAHIINEDGDKKHCLVPQDYTIFIPLSSELIVSAKGDTAFSGYIALLFGDFPQIGPETVELLVLLPALLSEIMATFLRKTPPYAHHLLALRDGVARHQEVMEELFATLQHGRTKDRAGALQVLNYSCQALVDNAQASGYLLHQRGKKATVHLQSLAIDELVLKELEILKPLGQRLGISMETALPENIQEAYVDPTLFPSMLHNLLAYCFSTCQAGDRISLSCEQESTAQIDVSVEVIFSGNVNSTWETERTYQPASTHSLLIANEIAHICGCTISENQIDNGVLFRLQVPISSLLLKPSSERPSLNK